MKILIIEDDQELVKTIEDFLKRDYITGSTSSGIDGEYQASTNEYDLVILDLSLSDKDGRVICRNLRKNKVDIPILILTGEHEMKTKVDLLDCGADDYLTKPFKFAELGARIRALLRRKGQAIRPNIISTNDVVLDTEKKTAKREDKTVHLRRKEYYLLEYLMRNAGKVLSRSMILDNVWEEEAEAATNVVDVHIKYLRDRIDRPFSKKVIKTIHGLGYKIEA